MSDLYDADVLEWSGRLAPILFTLQSEWRH